MRQIIQNIGTVLKTGLIPAISQSFIKFSRQLGQKKKKVKRQLQSSDIAIHNKLINCVNFLPETFFICWEMSTYH